MKKEDSPNIEFSHTRTFQIKSSLSSREEPIDWASQIQINDQTRTIYYNSNQKKTKITVHKNVNRW